jgi:hypothetical protein
MKVIKMTRMNLSDHPMHDTVNFINKWESGETTEEEMIEGFQHLIDTGTISHLQGCYQRQAAELIEAGLCQA